MDDTENVDTELTESYCQRFGCLAVEMGFSTSEQVQAAMAEQVADDLARKSHRLMGRILLDKGWITPEQVEKVLNELFKNPVTEQGSE